jgi:hypothetical protein
VQSRFALTATGNARDASIAVSVAAVSVATMAIDHLIGTEAEPGESLPVQRFCASTA